jgi:hypothetical protein
MERASMEDVVSRAVRMLISPKSNVKITCSSCGEVALQTTTEALHLGGSIGKWSRNPSAGALLLQTTESTDYKRMLLVKKGAVVLYAQQVVCAGLEHDLNGNGGFKTHLKSETHHLCNKCTTTPGTSMRLRIDAQISTDTEVAYIDTTIRILVGDNAKVRVCCPVCSDGLHKGTLLPPPRTSVKSSEKLKACAMGMIAEHGETHDTQRHGQLLYFSRNTGTTREVGILVWVVDQRVAVIEVDDISEVFTENAVCYSLTATNKQCDIHRQFPMSCNVCAKNIRSMDAATTVDQIDGYVIAQSSQNTLSLMHVSYAWMCISG